MGLFYTAPEPTRGETGESGCGCRDVRTYDGQRGVGSHSPRVVAGSAGVNSVVLTLHVHDEEHVVVGHHMHAAFARRREVEPAVLLPRHLGTRRALGGTLEPGSAAGADGLIRRSLHQTRIHCYIDTHMFNGPLIEVQTCILPS